MEAIPKLAMVSFDAKQSPENLDLAAKLRHLIAEKFGEDPSAFAAEIRELETLRANSCIRMSETIEGVATLKKYYCQLIFLQNRYRYWCTVILGLAVNILQTDFENVLFYWP